MHAPNNKPDHFFPSFFPFFLEIKIPPPRLQHTRNLQISTEFYTIRIYPLVKKEEKAVKKKKKNGLSAGFRGPAHHNPRACAQQFTSRTRAREYISIFFCRRRARRDELLSIRCICIISVRACIPACVYTRAYP